MHFKPDDIKKFEKIFDRSKGVFVENTLQHPYLKEGVVPSFLPGCPEYCSKPVSNRRTLNDKIQEREDDDLIRCIAESIETKKQYEKEKNISNFNEFREGLKKNGSWNDWTIIYNEKEIIFVSFTRLPIVKVMCSIVVDSACNAQIFNDVIELEKFRTKLNDFNQFEKLLSEVRVACNIDTDKCVDTSVDSRVKNYISAIECILLKIQELVSDGEKLRVISYLLEQVPMPVFIIFFCDLKISFLFFVIFR